MVHISSANLFALKPRRVLNFTCMLQDLFRDIFDGSHSLYRYDYENCDSAAAQKMMDLLWKFIADKANIGKVFTSGDKKFKVAKAEDFEYTDPIDKSVVKNQVLPTSGGRRKLHELRNEKYGLVNKTPTEKWEFRNSAIKIVKIREASL